MKTNIFKITAIMLLVVGIFASCTEKKSSQEDASIFVENGIVKYTPPEDNCNAYMIVIEQEDPAYNKYYKPDQLSDQFKVDNLQVKVQFRITEDKHNCGFGGYVPVINIIKIEKR